MKPNRNSRRKFTVRFKDAVPADEARLMLTTLRHADGMEEAGLVDGKLIVEYRFPGTTIAAVLAVVDQAAGTYRQQPLNRFINHCRAFMEKNERGNLLSNCGWHRYIEDVYMHHFDTGQNTRVDVRKQTWRKYK